MAKIKPSALLQEIRGSLNGSFIQQSNYGLQLSRKPQTVNHRSLGQSTIQQRLKFLTSKWKELTEVERKSWVNQQDVTEKGLVLFIIRNSNILETNRPFIKSYAGTPTLAILEGTDTVINQYIGYRPNHIDTTTTVVIPSSANTFIPTCRMSVSYSAGAKVNPKNLFISPNPVIIATNPKLILRMNTPANPIPPFPIIEWKRVRKIRIIIKAIDPDSGYQIAAYASKELSTIP